jgi:hypothetical protein
MWKHTFGAVLLAMVVAQPAVAFVPIPCAGDAIAQAPVALSAADEAFRSVWRDASPNWFTVFETRPPKRNIFDKSPEPEVPMVTIKGVVWAHGLYCLGNMSPDGREVLVRYYARVTAFHEGDGWSRPFENGLLQSFLVKRRADLPDRTGPPETWRAEVVADDRSILLPNTAKSKPSLESIPPTELKTGVPCRSGTAWDGKSCLVVAVKRQTAR